MFMQRAAGRRRRQGGGGDPGIPPANVSLPTLVSTEPNLIYTAGTWTGAASVSARLLVNAVDVGPANPSMPIQAAWRGQPCQVREVATNPDGSVPATSNTVTPATLDVLMAAALAGKVGYAFDGHDAATMFQDNLGTVPVTAPGQPVGLWQSKWGAAPITATQATVALAPVWDGAALGFDGVDDSVGITGAANWVGKTHVTATVRFKMERIAGNQAIYTLWFNSNGASGLVNWHITATGQINASVREASGGTALQAVLSAAGLVQVGVEHTLTIEIDWTTGIVLARLDGVQVINFTLAGLTGPIAWTVNNSRFGRTAANGFTAQVDIERWVLLHEAVNPATRDLFEAWVGEAA